MSNLGLCWALYSQFFAQITKKLLRLNGVIFPQPCNAANLALESDHKLVPIVNDAAAVSTLCRCWCHNGHCWLGSVECVKKLLKHCVPSMQVPLYKYDYNIGLSWPNFNCDLVAIRMDAETLSRTGFHPVLAAFQRKVTAETLKWRREKYQLEALFKYLSPLQLLRQGVIRKVPDLVNIKTKS